MEPNGSKSFQCIQSAKEYIGQKERERKNRRDRQARTLQVFCDFIRSNITAPSRAAQDNQPKFSKVIFPFLLLLLLVCPKLMANRKWALSSECGSRLTTRQSLSLFLGSMPLLSIWPPPPLFSFLKSHNISWASIRSRKALDGREITLTDKPVTQSPD